MFSLPRRDVTPLTPPCRAARGCTRWPGDSHSGHLAAVRMRGEGQQLGGGAVGILVQADLGVDN